jgi:hypothetical protein
MFDDPRWSERQLESPGAAHSESCGGLTDACRNVLMTLEIYDVAYRNLTEQGEPLAGAVTVQRVG